MKGMYMATTTKDHNKLIGHRIFFFRTLRGITQMELAHALGYTSRGSISRIEQGDIGMKKANIAVAAKFLGVHPLVLTIEEQLTDDQLVLINDFITILKDKSKGRITDQIKLLINNTTK